MLPFLTKNKEGSETERGGVIAVNFQDFIEFYHLFLSIDFSFTQIFDFHTVSYFFAVQHIFGDRHQCVTGIMG